jgi:hypothetical protein
MNENTFEQILSSRLTKLVILVILFLFSILTGFAVWEDGMIGIFLGQFKTFGGAQVLIDLMIALSFILVWMWFDTKKTGAMFLPWFLITLIAGSYGPLLYLLFRKSNQN